MEQKISPKQLEARSSLPEDLREVHDKIVSDYKYAAGIWHGKPYVSYVVLADMVRAGWRLSAEPIKQNQ